MTSSTLSVVSIRPPKCGLATTSNRSIFDSVPPAITIQRTTSGLVSSNYKGWLPLLYSYPKFLKKCCSSSDVASFFQPSIDCITETMEDICEHSTYPISVSRGSFYQTFSESEFENQHVVLVGGFSASEWLYKRLAAAVEPRKLQILRPQVHP